MDQKVESPSGFMRVGHIPAGPGSRKYRRRLIACAAVLVAGSLGAPITYALLSGSGFVIPGAAAAASFAKEMMNRSPGARTDAALIKTKNRPRIEMLSDAVMPKLDAAPPSLPAILGAVSAPPIIDTVLPPDVVLAGAEPVLPAGGPGVPLPGGGGVPTGGGVTPPGTDTPTPNVVVPAVPEPSTWATMLLGFLLTGWAIRRRPVRKRGSAAHCQA